MRYAWLGQTESDRLEDENIVQLRSSGSTRGSAPSPPAPVEPSGNGYPESDWTALVAGLCCLLIGLALFLTWLGPHA